MTPRDEELLQRALDDAVSPSERVELEAALAADAEFAQQAQRLSELNRRLRSWPEADAPAGLRADVLAAIRPRRGRAAAGSTLRRRDAIFFLAGAAATAILTLGLSRWAGSVREADSAATAGQHSVRSQPIDVEGTRLGEFRWTPSSNGPSLELHWSAATAARLELELDPAAASTLRVRVGESTSSILLGASDSAP
jgi:hypothetical protein